MTIAPADPRFRVWRDVNEIPAERGPCVVTLGVFDGVHRGHADLIDRAVQLGHLSGTPSTLVTFDPHPARIVGQPRDTATLTTIAHRAELARQRGVDAVLVVPFNRDLAALSPPDFVQEILLTRLRARDVVVGTNFTFGHRGEGTPETLLGLGSEHGFTTHVVPLLPAEGTVCSSSYVRACLRRGDVRSASNVLGRPHRLHGHCEQFGEVSRFQAEPGMALPASGRYIGEVPGGRRTEVRIEADGVVTIAASLAPGATWVDFHDGLLDRTLDC